MPAPSKRRLHGDTSRSATAAAIQLKPQAKASKTTSSLAVVAASLLAFFGDMGRRLPGRKLPRKL